MVEWTDLGERFLVLFDLCLIDNAFARAHENLGSAAKRSKDECPLTYMVTIQRG
jgi:hypothetical protein